MYHLQRVYDFDRSSSAPAVLLDRLWPRGVSKQRLQGIPWEKDACPSTELRRWFHADPVARFTEFAQRYRQELCQPAAQAALQRICHMAQASGSLILLTAAKHPQHSHLAVLAQILRGMRANR